ncbi:MAG TPA: ABC transporter ATP-binding protein [Gaiellaceae bacterium]|nr:ABC transporter ATP-binding protein [Gaiellaceae bacterium]
MAAAGAAAVRSGGKVEAVNVSVHFEGVRAVDGVDLVLEQGEILGLIGPNGAGKTTFVNAVTGFQPLTAGSVAIDGQDVTGWGASRLARSGLVRTFQSVRLFPRLSVLENVEAAGVANGLTRRAARDIAQELLERFGLGGRADQDGRGLSHGQERALGIARALAARPRYLLLDEPAAGLNEAEGDALIRVLAGVRDDFECGLLVIEHDMRVIMRLCERIHVLDYGKTLAVGTPAEVRTNPAVLTAYLGRRREKHDA